MRKVKLKKEKTQHITLAVHLVKIERYPLLIEIFWLYKIKICFFY